jgi:hypothetical protein
MLCMSAQSAHIQTTRSGAKPPLALTPPEVRVLVFSLDGQYLSSLPISYFRHSYHP